MGDVGHADLAGMPEAVVEMLKRAAANAAHLAKILKAKNYPGVEG
ncbi:MAG TPA: hypothetical protein VIZ90_10700 [Rhizobiaceae bacterium]